MEGSVAEEQYLENSHSANVGLYQSLTFENCEEKDLWHEDGSLPEGYYEELDSSDLQREWQRRRNQFHTIGYRDGLMACKESSAQDDFNVGFKESVIVVYKWGLIRGVTSALACLPDRLKERLAETQEKRIKFQHLYESVFSLSTTDKSKLFYDKLMNKSVEQSENVEPSLLRIYYEELQLLVLESPAIKIHSQID